LTRVQRLYSRQKNLQNFILDINKEVPTAWTGKTYKCLGFRESIGTRHKQMKERLKKEYTKRLKMIMKSELNVKNKTIAIGALVTPVLRYSFGIINWRLEEIRKIDRETTRTLTMYKIHNPKLIYGVNRTYVKKERRKKRSVSK